MSKADKRENIIMVYSKSAQARRAISPHSRSRVNLSPLNGVRHSIACFFVSFLRIPAADWMEIKTNHMVVITRKMNLLQIPIKDKFYVTPSDPAALTRATEFAQEKGLLNPRKAIPPSDSSLKPSRRLVQSHCC